MPQILPQPETFGNVFARNLGAGVGAGVARGADLYADLGAKLAFEREKSNMARQKQRDIYDLMVGQGLNPEDAALYSALTTGGQTAFAKDVLEGRKRGLLDFGSKASETTKTQILPKESFDESMKATGEKALGRLIDVKLKKILEGQDVGLTPSERVRRSSERYKAGLPIYEDAQKRLHSLASQRDSFKILESLNKSKKLPKHVGYVNVDEEGNLRFPFASTPESQRYAKTLAQLASTTAKETFGARVTDFDLKSAFRQNPTLLNTDEGRRQILEQMKIVNDINAIYYKNLNGILKKAGGIRNIDIDQAQELASEMSEPQIEELRKKFSRIGIMEEKPNPADHPGQKLRDETSGQLYESNGQEWVPVGK